MATPQSTASHDQAGSGRSLEQITFRFCSECSNMLYPKEDEDTHKLQFTCRTCQYTEEASSTCVFRNVLNNSAGETAGVTQDVGSDPTVSDAPCLCFSCGSPINCAHCGLPADFAACFLPDPGRPSRPAAEHRAAGDYLASLLAANTAEPSADYDDEPEPDTPGPLDNSDSCSSTATAPAAAANAADGPAVLATVVASAAGNAVNPAPVISEAAADVSRRYRLLCEALYADMTVRI